MARTKSATVKKFPATERCTTRSTVKPFKIKEILPEQKTVEIRKNGQIIKTINVRKKSRYFSGRNRLIF